MSFVQARVAMLLAISSISMNQQCVLNELKGARPIDIMRFKKCNRFLSQQADISVLVSALRSS